MSEWKRVKIGEFLNQYRNTIYVEDEKNYGQITISKHDGVQFRENKKGKDIGRKRQFLIDLTTYPNTLIFTRQGVADGSIGFAPEAVNGCIATENMPMFSIDEKIVLKEYFSLILKSDIFMDEVAEITPTGSAQKSIHENQLLQLEITIPKTIEEQKRIVKELISKIEKVDSTSAEIDKQKSYAKQLRQSVLQDAIEGKLTADWRKSHPVEKGNPDYDAEALFQKIQEEKEKQATGKKKSSEKLAEISDEEKPFSIPTGWKWVKLGEIGVLERGRSKHRPRNDESLFINGNIPFIQTGEVAQSKMTGFKILSCEKYYNSKGLAQSRLWQSGTLCITIAANIAETGFLTFNACFPDSVVGFSSVINGDLPFFVRYYVSSIQQILEANAPATAQKNINLGILDNVGFPLPPLAEQTEIVRRVEIQLDKIIQIEQQIATHEEITKELMHNILRDAFEGEK